MNYKDKIDKIIEKQNGTILSSDLDKYGIPRTYLKMMVAEGSIEKVDRGIYVSEDSIEDEMFALQKKYSKIIYSHETALYIQDLSDRIPIKYTATVPSGYKVVPNVSEKFKIYYIKKELHKLGVTTEKTIYGNEILTYNIERTICDILRSKSRIDVQILNPAIRKFVKSKNADYYLLMKYAKKLKIETVVNKYLEVLLWVEKLWVSKQK